MARTNKNRAPALAYLRTSSAANVGTDKDSEKLQRHAIQGFAKRGGFEIIAEFYDAAVSGADPIETRAGFAALLDRIEGNGVRTVCQKQTFSIAPPRLVSKLGHAREHVRQEKGKCEGRKPHVELRPEAVALAKRLHRASPKTGRRMSLRKIATELAAGSHLNERGQPFNPKKCAVCLTG